MSKIYLQYGMKTRGAATTSAETHVAEATDAETPGDKTHCAETPDAETISAGNVQFP